MGEGLLTAAVLLLALYGCAQGVRRLSARLLGDGTKQAVVVLPLSGHCEDVEYRIRSCLHIVSGTPMAVWVVDRGLDESSRTLAKTVCEGFNGVRFITR